MLPYRPMLLGCSKHCPYLCCVKAKTMRNIDMMVSLCGGMRSEKARRFLGGKCARVMRAHAARRGCELVHRSRPVTTDDFFDFDLIVGMDDRNALCV